MIAYIKSAGAFRRHRLALSVSTLGLVAAALMPQQAAAQNECGAATNDRVVCDPAGNPYPNGVNYLDADTLTLATAPTTIITGGALVVTGADGIVDNAGRVSSAAAGRAGVRLTSGQAASYTGMGSVATTGDFAPGIVVSAAGPVSIVARDVSTTGNGSGAIVAMGSSVDVSVTGRVSTTGTAATVGAGGVGGGFPTGGASNPGLDPADLTGPSAIVFFDYFFSDNLGFPADNLNAFIQWNVTGGSVDLVGGVGPGVFGAPPNQPLGRYVDLGGSTGNPGRFETRLAYPVNPGTFNLSFDYRSTGGDLNTATGSVTGLLGTTYASYTVSSDLTTFRRFSGNFAIDAIDLVRIAFQGLESDTDNSGIGIDGVLFGPVLPVGPGGTGATMGGAFGFLPAGTRLSADAVTATATGGAARVTNSGLITTTGFGSRGIVATGTTGVTIAGTGRVTTAGDLASGIDASSPGAVSVTQGSVATTGMMAPAIRATSTGAGVVSVDVGSVSTSGFASRGVDAFANNGAVSVRVGSASTSGSNADAIVAMNNAGGAVSVVATGPVVTTAASSAGIRAMSAAGTASVQAASVSTAGVGSTAITAAGATGATVITSGSISVAGVNTPAIVATTVSGPATVTTSGAVSKTGAGGNAVFVQSTNGAATYNVASLTSAGGGAVVTAGTLAAINVGGAVSAADTALTANGATANVSVAGGGSVTSGGDAIALQGRTASTLTNAGMIFSTGSGRAVVALSGPATVNNSGTIAGRVQFGAGGDRFVNSGTFTSTLDSDFGAGVDTFDNTGVVRALATSRRVAFNNLEAFNNAGLVELRNGSAGDTLVLPGTFTGSGASTLGLDIAFGAAPSADRLAVGTAVGSTAVILASSGPVTLSPDVVIVQATGASSAGAFTLAPGSTGTALVGLSIAYDPATLSYAIVGTPQAGVFRTISAAEGVRNLWHTSADAWSGHVRELRDDATVEGTAIWGQFYGATNSRDNDRSFATFGRSSTQAIGYRQDAFGAQAGLDVGRMDADGGFVVGVTGGYLNSSLDFRAVADRTTYDVINAGAYASFRGGPFFVNALGKYDWVDVKLRAPTIGVVARPDARAWGGQLEAGLRFGGAAFFVEPIVGVSYVDSRLGDLDGLDAIGSRIAVNSQNGVRGTAGLRLGATRTRASGNVMSVYASGEAVKQFRGRDRIAFTSGATTIGFDGGRIGTYGRGTLGVNIAMPGGVTGFLEAHGEYGDDWKGGGGRGGLRVAF